MDITFGKCLAKGPSNIKILDNVLRHTAPQWRTDLTNTQNLISYTVNNNNLHPNRYILETEKIKRACMDKYLHNFKYSLGAG
jgi:hypothetical protein